MAVSALFPTLATAASISSVVLLRRLRIRRAKSLVVMTTRLRGGFGRDEAATAALRWINNEPANYFSFPIRLLEEEIVFSVRVINRHFAVHWSMSALGHKRTNVGGSGLTANYT